jgi:nucleotide-binding universal stress UspA family protein
MITNLVVVGIDDSAPSRVAMEWAADYARMMDAKLKAIYVRPAVDPGHRTRTESALRVLDGCTEQRVSAIFDSVDPEPGWIFTTVTGRPAEVLVNAAEHAIVLVVGSRQAAGLDGPRRTSVSRHCTLYARAPVVVCPDLDAVAARPGGAGGGQPAVAEPAPRIAIRRPVIATGLIRPVGFRPAVRPSRSAGGQ